MPLYIIITFSAFFISLIGTKLVILTLRNSLKSPDINIMTGKKKAPVPTNGGIALVFAIIIGFLGVQTNYTYILILAIFMLTAIPLLSNVMPIHQIAKVAIRLLAISVALTTFNTSIFIDFDRMPPTLIDKFFAGFFWLWIIYSFDRLEKVEGLMPLGMISIGLGLCALTVLSGTFFDDFSIQALIFAAAGVGFLWWNHHPAKILAGEIASIPVGFVAGYLLLSAASEGHIIAIFIIAAYFLTDSFVTFFNRPFSEKFSKQSIDIPCCALRAIMNSRKPQWIVRVITGINILLIFIAVQSMLHDYMAIFNLIIAYIMVFTIIWFFLRKKAR
ncbi:MAG: hypothetical protein R3D71_00330 [Rickettsiales bacterium]